MRTAWHDFRYAGRTLAQHPWFTAAIVATLALGIGLNATVFSLVNAVLFRPLPVERPDELVNIYRFEKGEGLSHGPLSYLNFRDLRDRNRAFQKLAAYEQVLLAIEEGDESRIVFGTACSGEFFQLLGVRPQIGRVLIPEDETAGGAPVAVLSHTTWQQRFGGDPAVVGRSVRVNGTPVTIVGVMPKGFVGLRRVVDSDLYVTLETSRQLWRRQDLDSRGSSSLFLAGRLRPGAALGPAKAEFDVLAKQLAEEHPEVNRDLRLALLPTSDVALLPDIDGIAGAASLVVLALGGLVLVVAGANIGNMMLARGLARRREVAIRSALGATRRRLVRQLATEGLLLALAGGVVALLAAAWIGPSIDAVQLPFSLRMAVGATVDARVIAYSFGLSLLSVLVFALAPALGASRLDLAGVLQAESGRTSAGGRKIRLRESLVVSQIAVSVVLLVGSALALRSLWNARTLDPGFEADSVSTATMMPLLRGYEGDRSRTFFRAALDRVRALPEVESAAFASHLPLTLTVNETRVLADSSPDVPREEWPRVDFATVSEGYFTTMGIALIEGRDFSSTGATEGADAVIVNETLARRFWPGESAVGKSVRMGSGKNPLEVIGVARDGKYRTLGEQPRPFAYLPFARDSSGLGVVVARTRSAPAAFLPSLRRAIREVDPEVPFAALETLKDATRTSLLLPRVSAALLGVVGALALFLATLGLYGVMAFAVGQRTHEMGIRRALGASRGEVLRLVVLQGLRLAGIGLAVGVALALAATRALGAILCGVSPTDPPTFVAVVLFLVAISLLACYLPARRAAAVDPISSLRCQ